MLACKSCWSRRRNGSVQGVATWYLPAPLRAKLLSQQVLASCQWQASRTPALLMSISAEALHPLKRIALHLQSRCFILVCSNLDCLALRG